MRRPRVSSLASGDWGRTGIPSASQCVPNCLDNTRRKHAPCSVQRRRPFCGQERGGGQELGGGRTMPTKMPVPTTPGMARSCVSRVSGSSCGERPAASGQLDRRQLMGELTAQVEISEFSNRKTRYEKNERVCGMSQCHQLARFRTRFYSWKKVGNPNLSG